jgi:hypothetical protein
MVRLRPAVLAAVFATGVCVPQGLAADAGAALRAEFIAAEAAMQDGPFGRPVRVSSVERGDAIEGEVLAEIARPLAALRGTLEDPAAWCEVLLLTPSISGCRALSAGAAPVLQVQLARRFDQASEDSFEARFTFTRIASTPDHVALGLSAHEGPLGTRDYHLGAEAATLDPRRSVIRMRYAYAYGLRAKLATRAYLATAGSEKIGFSSEPDGSAGARRPIKGMRGSVERNAMRYFLALDAYAAQDAGTPTARFPQALDTWLAAIQRYPRQLAEPDPVAYRRIKLAQHQAPP